MNPGQQMFFDFFMQRVKPEHAEAAKQVLEENFKRQDEGTFSMEHMKASMEKLMSYVREECIGELQQAAAHMSSTMKQ